MIDLRPISQEDFDQYIIKAIKGYQEELIVSGFTKEAAIKTAEDSFNRALPEGLKTPKHYLQQAYDNEDLVGFIWYGLRGKTSAFIYDFYIEENMRRKGYGRRVMLACENEAKEKGITEMRLHVFGHNTGARKLYESLNYTPTNIQMKKEL